MKTTIPGDLPATVPALPPTRHTLWSYALAKPLLSAAKVYPLRLLDIYPTADEALSLGLSMPPDLAREILEKPLYRDVYRGRIKGFDLLILQTPEEPGSFYGIAKRGRLWILAYGRMDDAFPSYPEAVRATASTDALYEALRLEPPTWLYVENGKPKAVASLETARLAQAPGLGFRPAEH